MEIIYFFIQTIKIPKNNKLSLLKICQIRYNIGQLSVYINKERVNIPIENINKYDIIIPNIFKKDTINYYYSNELYNLEKYINYLQMN
jgi:hypothetical protein